MEKILIKVPELISKMIKQDYGDKLVLIYDCHSDFHTDFEDWEPSHDTVLYVFKTLKEAVNELTYHANLNLVNNFAKFWVFGEADNTLIYNLRG